MEAGMDQMRTWIIAVVSLIVGAAVAYLYTQQQTSKLSEQISMLQTQVVEANKKAQSATSEIEGLKADLDEKTKLIEKQKAKLTKLEAALQQTTSPTPE